MDWLENGDNGAGREHSARTIASLNSRDGMEFDSDDGDLGSDSSGSAMCLDEDGIISQDQDIRRFMLGSKKPGSKSGVLLQNRRGSSHHSTTISNLLTANRKRQHSVLGFGDDRPSPFRRRIDTIPVKPSRSYLDELPREITQQIAIYLPKDADLSNFTSSCSRLARTVIPNRSGVWKARFLARYDYPFVCSANEFRPAYALRRCVLKNFVGFGQEMSHRGLIQIEVLRDMILETYHEPRHGLQAPAASRNLRLFASPQNSPWMVTFLATSFVGSDKEKYGVPNSIYESIQLVFSHLVLSPRSALTFEVLVARNGYDLLKVYNFNQSLATIYKRQQSAPDPRLSPHSQFRPKRLSDQVTAFFDYTLDTNILLHIRNFWHRYVVDTSFNGCKTDAEQIPRQKNSASIMDRLATMDLTPKGWSSPLQSYVPFSSTWYGHLSALTPWPANLKGLEEQHGLADTWDAVASRSLSVCTTQDPQKGFWPAIFSSIPAFAETTNVSELPEDGMHEISNHSGSKAVSCNHLRNIQVASCEIHEPVYIRGIAPHLTSDRVSAMTSMNRNTTIDLITSASDSISLSEAHPFLARRVQGVISSIDSRSTITTSDIPTSRNGSEPANYTIPGWQRICMVIWKPSKRYLLSVLEHANEDFGGSHNVSISNAIQHQIPNTSSIWNTQCSSITTSPTDHDASTTTNVDADAAEQSPAQPHPAPQQQPTMQTPTQTENQPQPQPLDTTIEEQLDRMLITRLTEYTRTHSLNLDPFTPANINRLEDKYTSPHFLDWHDGTIEDAHAFEGAILPGGKIMLGRFWRCHGNGSGEGMEIGIDGEGIRFDDDGVVLASEDSASEHDEDMSVSVDTRAEVVNSVSDGDGNGDGDVVMLGVNGWSQSSPETSDRRVSRNRALDRGPFIFWC